MVERTLTVDDVKHKAEEVRDIARAEVQVVLHSDAAKLVGVAIVGVLVIASLTFFLGSRMCSCGDAAE